MFSNVFDTVAVWLTVYLSFFRYFFVRSLISKPVINSSEKFRRISINNINNINYVRIIILIIFILGLIAALPANTYLKITEKKYDNTISENKSVSENCFCLELTELDLNSNGLVIYFLFYFQVIFGKPLSCFLMTLFTSLTIRELLLIKSKKNRLLNQKLTISQLNVKSNELEDGELIIYHPRKHSFANALNFIKENHSSKINNMRTTVMLATICFLFVLFEIPITVLIFSIPKAFYLFFYKTVMELMDLSMLIYSLANLAIYWSMSGEFKKIIKSKQGKICD